MSRPALACQWCGVALAYGEAWTQTVPVWPRLPIPAAGTAPLTEYQRTALYGCAACAEMLARTHYPCCPLPDRTRLPYEPDLHGPHDWERLVRCVRCDYELHAHHCTDGVCLACRLREHFPQEAR